MDALTLEAAGGALLAALPPLGTAREDVLLLFAGGFPIPAAAIAVVGLVAFPPLVPVGVSRPEPPPPTTSASPTDALLLPSATGDGRATDGGGTITLV